MTYNNAKCKAMACRYISHNRPTAQLTHTLTLCYKIVCSVKEAFAKKSPTEPERQLESQLSRMTKRYTLLRSDCCIQR